MKKGISSNKKINYKKLILIIIFIIFVILCSYFLFKIIIWKLDNNTIKKQKEIIQQQVNIKMIPAPIAINTPFYNVNIEKLLIENNDTKGWIHMNGTEINYPFVQASDNEYYLNRDFYQKKNSAGWIFLDYRNKIDILDKNTILYGHNRTDKSMFGSIRDLLNNDWLKNEDNFYIQTSTEKQDQIWKIFSVYHIKTTSDYLQINFEDDNQFLNFINKLKNRSAYNFNVDVNKDDHIITLSTCYGKDHRSVVHAKLIDIKEKEQS